MAVDKKETIARLNDFGQKIVDGVRDEQQLQGITASGASADSLRVEADAISLRVIGSAYFFQQVVGRNPGKFPFGRGDIPSWKPGGSIYEWITQKRLSFSGITQKSLAYLFSRKIAEKGTDVHQGKRPGLNISAVFQKIKGDLLASLAQKESKDILIEITGQ